MTTEMDGLREALFAQMRLPPLPEYSGDAVILRASNVRMPGPSVRVLAATGSSKLPRRGFIAQS
jgi:hypothetical protein